MPQPMSDPMKCWVFCYNCVVDWEAVTLVQVLGSKGRNEIGRLCNVGAKATQELASPSIYTIQLIDPKLIPRLCGDMIAHVVRLIWSSREGNEQ